MENNKINIIKLIKLIVFLFVSFSSAIVFAQSTKIRGKVVDSRTKEAIPFVNISFKNTTVGTITDFEGNYFIETKIPVDSILFSYIGYHSQKFYVQKFQLTNLNVELKSQNVNLAEIVVVPGENPALILLDKIIENKDKNNSNEFDYYSCEVYNKAEIDVYNYDEELENKKALKQFKFIFDYVDTSVVSGKSYLPVLMSESLSDYYFRKNPKKELEIIKASKISGIENQSLSQFTGEMYQDFNFYENLITIFDQPFVSPIAKFGKFYYQYYLIDSAFIDNLWCYQISFKPKRKQEFTFTGNFWVNDTSFAIKKYKIRIAKDVNINFINDFIDESEYVKIADKWLLNKTGLFIDFNIAERTTGFFGKKTTFYRKYKIGKPENEKIFSNLSEVIVDEQAFNKSNEFWKNVRPEKLSAKEKKIYQMVDSIKNIPLFNTVIDIISTFVTGYYVKNNFEFGPYYTFLSFNEIEGMRFKLGGRTSNKFSTKIMLDGHIAVSTKDEVNMGKLKFGIGGRYMFSKNPRQSIRVHYQDDVEQLGKSQNAFLDDNILSSILQRNPIYKLTNTKIFTGFYEREWFQGFSNTLTFTYKKMYPSDSIPLIYNSTAYSSLISSELKLNTRFAYKERFVFGEFERTSLGTQFPVVNLNFSYGINNLFHSSFEYFKIDLNYYHWFNISTFGWFKYIIDLGKIYGTLPYPLLRLHEGNETYALDDFAFNMMNYYEFVSDRYISIFAEHHFMGLFLNKVPLFRKLKFREVAYIKALAGELDAKNMEYFDFPSSLSALNKPYFEAGIGLENIFKFIRVDAVWRLSHLDKPNVQAFGIRAKLQFYF